MTLGKWRDEIAGMLDKRFYTIEWVDEQINTGGITTLGNDEAIIGLQVKRYPGGAKELHGMFAAGKLEEIKRLIDQALEIGREIGCDCATIASRPGWTKLLKDKGFEMHQVTIMKELV